MIIIFYIIELFFHIFKQDQHLPFLYTYLLTDFQNITRLNYWVTIKYYMYKNLVFYHKFSFLVLLLYDLFEFLYTRQNLKVQLKKKSNSFMLV